MSKLGDLIKNLCPNGVEFKNFSKVVEYVRGVTYRKSDETTDGIPVLRANNITFEKNILNFEDVKYIKKTVSIRPNQFLFKDDILICAGSGSKEHIGKIAYIFENMNYAFGGFMAVIRVKNFKEVLPRFLFHNLTSFNFRNYLRSKIDSSTINNLNENVIANF